MDFLRDDLNVGMFGVNVGNVCDARRKLKNSERNMSGDGLNILKRNILRKICIGSFLKYILNAIRDEDDTIILMKCSCVKTFFLSQNFYNFSVFRLVLRNRE